VTPVSAIAQLRTTDLPRTLRFYTEVVGLRPAFTYEDFYAGLWAGEQLLHLKRADAPDPGLDALAEAGHLHLYLDTPDARALAASIEAKGVALFRSVHDTPWGRREFWLRDDHGHILCFGEAI